jgi:predicted transcriptional regulator
MVIARKQTLVQLSDEILTVLDREATRRRMSRSALIREAIDAHFHDAIEAEIDRRIVEAYTRYPPTEEEFDWSAEWAEWQARRAIRQEPW